MGMICNHVGSNLKLETFVPGGKEGPKPALILAPTPTPTPTPFVYQRYEVEVEVALAL